VPLRSETEPGGALLPPGSSFYIINYAPIAIFWLLVAYLSVGYCPSLSLSY
jgi:hypothetical protein